MSTTARPPAGEASVQGGTERVRRSNRRRRPSGEPPPLPRALRTSGRLLVAGLLSVVLLLILVIVIPDFGLVITRIDLAVLSVFTELRTDAGTSIARAVDALGSDWTIGILRWATILPLIFFRRFRHLFVYLGTILVCGGIVSILSLAVTRERPLGIEILGHWEGPSFPSRPVAVLAVSLIGITYSLVVPGRPRMVAKVVSTVLIFALVFAELYLGIAHPVDIAVAAIIGAAIPVVAFRSLTPNEVFPVQYKRGRAAHLDVGGKRGEAIRTGVQDQLGITVLDMKPFGLAGSGGSTPLLLTVAGEGEDVLFAKLYAATHLRADRWYKLGRTLLYGRLEDETSFSTVRRLIQYEDYMLRVMQDAGIRGPAPHGFVEITPEREYMLVTDFLAGAKEILDIEVTDELIDDALYLVRDLWHAGLAHRDIKPSNILVRDGRVYLIDVAFGQVRPSPWREAVDLANMMIVLALQSSPERVYARATNIFTPDDVAEAFAATHGVTIPSQSRNLLKKEQTHDVVAKFRELAPKRKHVSIQRWSIRRVALTIGVALAAFVALVFALGNLQGAGLLSDPESAQVAFRTARPECDSEFQQVQFVLESQSVPSATLLPCIATLPTGWAFRSLEVVDGESRLSLDSDRAGADAASVTLTRSCDTSGATEVPTDEPGTHRFERIDTLDNRYVGARFYTFEGGCATYRFDFSGTGRTALAEEASLAMGFISRAKIESDLRKEADLELRPEADL